MFICIIDTDGDHGPAIEQALRGLFDLGPADYSLLAGATVGSPYGAEPQSYSAAPDDAARRRMEAEMWDASQARQANPRLGQPVDPLAGIDPSDHLISPATSLGYTPDGQTLIPLDLGNGQIVYVPQSAVPEPTIYPPVEQYPTAPSEPHMPPYLVAQPYTVDPTDSLIPEYGHDQFQQFTPQVPQVIQNMPQEPSIDELNVWAAQQRAQAVANLQAQQMAEMAARGINTTTPQPDFTGFPQTPEVNYARPTPNL